MKLNGNSLDEVLKKETLSDEDIVFLLGLTDPEDCTKLQQAAYEKTTELMGNKVYYRGLIEVSNVARLIAVTAVSEKTITLSADTR